MTAARTAARPPRGSRHVALLRGINVGGRNRVAMSDLVAAFSELGCTDVGTFIQSGNVVFRAPATVLRGLAGRVTASLRAASGLEIPVVLRSAVELAAVARGNPFLARGGDTRPLHVMFLRDAPPVDRIAELDPDRSPPDRFQVIGREIYLCCPNGMGVSKLTNDWFDRRLGTIGTGRNWNTVLELCRLAAE